MPFIDTQRIFADVLARHQLGDLASAEKGYREILRADSHQLDAAYLLGLVLLQGGRFEQAEAQFRRAIKINPNVAAAFNDRGNALLELARPEGKALSAIDGPLVATIVRERQRDRVTNATIRRDLGALSSIMNFAILQSWIEVNPVIAKLALVPEKRDPILLPTDRDIALVIKHAPGMVGQMVMAALKTGAREEELVKAQRGDLDHSRKQLTVIGKGNKLRVIDVRPFDGYAFLAVLPAYVGKPHLFWHGKGAPYSSFAPTFNKLMTRVETWAKDNGVEFRRFRFHHLRHRHAVDWLKSGGDIYTLQGRLGHTSVKTIEMYLEYLTPEEVQIAKFGAAKRAAGSTIGDTAAAAK